MTKISKSLIALAISAASAATFAAPAPFGEPATGVVANRTVTIGTDTKWVNVTEGDVVKFDVNGKQVSWNFDGASFAPVDLARLVPDAKVARRVMVYIQPKEAFSPGSD